MNSSETAAKPRIAIPEPSSLDPGYSRKKLPVYLHALQESGSIPIVVPLAAPPEEMAEIISTCAGALLPGSRADIDSKKYGSAACAACHPQDSPREAADEFLLRDSFNLGKPLLCICYGIQSLNVWLNGTLIQDLADDRTGEAPGIDHRRQEHEVEVEADSRLGGILSALPHVKQTGSTPPRLLIPVNSTHHQAVLAPGDQVRAVARSSGDGVVEAIEAKNRRGSEQYIIGVQWHPERTYDEEGDQGEVSRLLFKSFVSAAASWRPRPAQVPVVR